MNSILIHDYTNQFMIKSSNWWVWKLFSHEEASFQWRDKIILSAGNEEEEIISPIFLLYYLRAHVLVRGGGRNGWLLRSISLHNFLTKTLNAGENIESDIQNIEAPRIDYSII